jgi:hypothetical protein
MKRQLTVALGLAVIATPALATKARLEALGEDNYGSYYINDNRNIFLNPASINNHKDLITYEFGRSARTRPNSGTTGGSAIDRGQNSNLDRPDTPKAEGGFTKSHGNLVYGLHFGNTTPTVGMFRNLPNPVAGSNLNEVQPWDLFVGGDAGIKWGASLTYESYDGNNNGGGRLASNSLRARGGVIMGDIEAFTHVSIKNEAKDFAGQSVEGDLGYLVGASTMVQNYRVFADWRQVNGDYRDAALTAGEERKLKYNQIRVGVGRQERLNDRATMFAKLHFDRQSYDDKGGAVTAANANTVALGALGNKATVMVVPVNVGLEYAATSWLDLRASVVNNVFSNAELKPTGQSKRSHHLANTGVRAGASLKFGEFAIDGLISTTADGDAGIGELSQEASTNAGNGALRTDALMTRVSMIYRF